MKLLTVILLLLLAGCSSYVKPPVVPPAFAGRYKMACLPEAAGMVYGLRERGIEANVLVYRPLRQEINHAIAVYFYPISRNQLNGWDSEHGSVRLRAYRDDPQMMARAWLRGIGEYPAVAWAGLLDDDWRGPTGYAPEPKITGTARSGLLDGIVNLLNR